MNEGRESKVRWGGRKMERDRNAPERNRGQTREGNKERWEEEELIKQRKRRKEKEKRNGHTYTLTEARRLSIERWTLEAIN